jgi:S1-C subfamily serine protease
MAQWFRSLLLPVLFAGFAGAQQTPPSPAQKTSSPPPGALHASDVLLGLSGDMESLAHAVEPAVVKIYAAGLAPVESGDTNRTAFLAQQRSVGSGVIMDPQGYILTNAHVVQRARTLNVLVPDTSGMVQTGGSDRAEPPATAMPARVVGLDTVTDLTDLSRIKSPEDAHPSSKPFNSFFTSVSCRTGSNSTVSPVTRCALR